MSAFDFMAQSLQLQSAHGTGCASAFDFIVWHCGLSAHCSGCTLFYLFGSGGNRNIMIFILCGFATIFYFSPPDAIRVYNPYPAALISN